MRLKLCRAFEQVDPVAQRAEPLALRHDHDAEDHHGEEQDAVHRRPCGSLIRAAPARVCATQAELHLRRGGAGVERDDGTELHEMPRVGE
ncbi:hypothetical protein [Sphingomonas sp. J315]|uniref:hypothetical protein n=1 Tax=Sphingomonas sp. J315 TaxID=2898433 RepID=UPI0021ADACB4|nr:hypothetical protein [Sphingomonas sp. J315]UUY01056.1 hypothetical protein LRS08_08435 [Sphingomonas sp. J315]